MQKLAEDGMFEPNFNSIDFAPAQVPWTQGKALHWYKGSFILGSFRGDQKQCCVVPTDWFAFPAFGDRKPIMSIYDEDTVMIHAASKNKDAAAEFVDWMVSPAASAKKLEIDKPYPSNASTDLSHLSEMEQRLGKAMADAGSYTFMHVDHGTPPAISDRFLDGLQGVLAGAISPDEAMQATETEAQRVRGKIKT
jgi:raffinose/stachyose/melibiose transport system substrate-binding protein